MSNIRLQKRTITSNFSIVPNDITFSTEMTLGERGALIWLLAKPEDYGINIKSLATHWHVGLHTVKKISKKLQLLGYLYIEKFGDGRTLWHISDHQINLNKSTMNVSVQNPHVENQPMAEPHVENPHVENPHVDNRPALVRTDLLIRTDHLKDISSSEAEQESNVSSVINKSFDKLWALWPNAKNKIRSQKAFKATVKSKSPTYIKILTERLQNDIEARLKAEQLGFTNMMLSTYLNNERYEDDITNGNNQSVDKLKDDRAAEKAKTNKWMRDAGYAV